MRLRTHSLRSVRHAHTRRPQRKAVQTGASAAAEVALAAYDGTSGMLLLFGGLAFSIAEAVVRSLPSLAAGIAGIIATALTAVAICASLLIDTLPAFLDATRASAIALLSTTSDLVLAIMTSPVMQWRPLAAPAAYTLTLSKIAANGFVLCAEYICAVLYALPLPAVALVSAIVLLAYRRASRRAGSDSAPPPTPRSAGVPPPPPSPTSPSSTAAALTSVVDGDGTSPNGSASSSAVLNQAVQQSTSQKATAAATASPDTSTFNRFFGSQGTQNSVLGDTTHSLVAKANAGLHTAPSPDDTSLAHGVLGACLSGNHLQVQQGLFQFQEMCKQASATAAASRQPCKQHIWMRRRPPSPPAPTASTVAAGVVSAQLSGQHVSVQNQGSWNEQCPSQATIAPRNAEISYAYSSASEGNSSSKSSLLNPNDGADSASITSPSSFLWEGNSTSSVYMEREEEHPCTDTKSDDADSTSFFDTAGYPTAPEPPVRPPGAIQAGVLEFGSKGEGVHIAQFPNKSTGRRGGTTWWHRQRTGEWSRQPEASISGNAIGLEGDEALSRAREEIDCFLGSLTEAPAKREEEKEEKDETAFAPSDHIEAEPEGNKQQAKGTEPGAPGADYHSGRAIAFSGKDENGCSEEALAQAMVEQVAREDVFERARRQAEQGETHPFASQLEWQTNEWVLLRHAVVDVTIAFAQFSPYALARVVRVLLHGGLELMLPYLRNRMQAAEVVDANEAREDNVIAFEHENNAKPESKSDMGNDGAGATTDGPGSSAPSAKNATGAGSSQLMLMQ